MGGWKSLTKAVRKVYDATSKSSSKIGKIGKWAVPFNAPYLTRDLWRKYGKKYVNGAYGSYGSANVNVSGSSASQLANTGFRSYRVVCGVH